MTDFNALLDAPLDNFEPPIPLPVGSYLAVISAPARIIEPRGDKAGGVEFEVTLTEAMQDVDQDLLKESLNGKPLSEQKQRLTFWLTDKSAYRLREFAEQHLKLAPGMTTREMLSQAAGIPFVAVLTQSASTRDPSKVYTNISQTAAVPE